MAQLTKATALAVGILAVLDAIAIGFARTVMLNLYQGMFGAGVDPALPVPTAMGLRAAGPVVLAAAGSLTLLVLAAAEWRVEGHRRRLVIHLACALAWAAFAGFCLWAFTLGMHIPEGVLE